MHRVRMLYQNLIINNSRRPKLRVISVVITCLRTSEQYDCLSYLKWIAEQLIGPFGMVSQ